MTVISKLQVDTHGFWRRLSVSGRAATFASFRTDLGSGVGRFAPPGFSTAEGNFAAMLLVCVETALLKGDDASMKVLDACLRFPSLSRSPSNDSCGNNSVDSEHSLQQSLQQSLVSSVDDCLLELAFEAIAQVLDDDAAAHAPAATTSVDDTLNFNKAGLMTILSSTYVRAFRVTMECFACSWGKEFWTALFDEMNSPLPPPPPPLSSQTPLGPEPVKRNEISIQPDDNSNDPHLNDEEEEVKRNTQELDLDEFLARET